jgi:2-oxoglutarate decarboxylase
MYIQRPGAEALAAARMEPIQANNWPKENEERLRILEDLLRGEEFEHFLDPASSARSASRSKARKPPSPILADWLNRAPRTTSTKWSSAWRIAGVSTCSPTSSASRWAADFSEFEGNIDPASTQGSGDVKYHLGASGVSSNAPSGREIVVSLAPIPAIWKPSIRWSKAWCAPKQDRLGDARARVIPLLIHGDAAFAGQGVVAETLNLSQLDGYCTGGTIHLIINNQIGFTTLPEDSRSTPYSTDIARMVQAPIFHVNGDDPEAAIRVAPGLRLPPAVQARRGDRHDLLPPPRPQRSRRPGYTQPIMYRKIKEHPSVASSTASGWCGRAC